MRLGLERDPAELQAEAALEFRQKVLGLGFEQARHVVGPLAPDDGRAVLHRAVALRFRLQGQDREGPGGEEMLDRPALVIALVHDGGDDAGLAIGPGNPADTGLLAQTRAPPIGRHQQSCRQDVAAPTVSRRARRVGAEALDALGRRLTPDARQASTSAPVRSPAVTMWAKGSPSPTSPSKVRKVGRTGIVQAAVGDDHVEDRLRLGPRPCPRFRAPASIRRAAAAMAKARLSPCGSRFSAGSHMTTSRLSPSACFSASDRDSPARPPPAMTMRDDPAALDALGAHDILPVDASA